MTWIPRFKLYDSDSITLVHQFEAPQQTNAPQSSIRHIPIEGVRGKGRLIIPAGTETWDLEIEGVLYIDAAVEDYQDLTAKIDEMENNIALNTAYYLRIDKTPSTYYEYKVKRVEPIEYHESLRTDSQRYTVRFIVNAW
jgi:hypothetical protein